MFTWLAGDPGLRDALEKALGGATPLPTRSASGGGRRHLRAGLPDGGALFLKRFPRPTRPGGRLARHLSLSAAEREWRALVAAHAAGVAVPAPRALIALPEGDRLLATDYVAGPSLARWQGDTRSRRSLLRGVGEQVRRLHAAGWVHGDLHAGNVLVAETGPLLVDFQAARRSRSARARRRDLGALDHSLSRARSLADRVRLAAAAQGLRSPFDAAARRALRAAARAGRARARAHAASRTRRSLRPGRRFAAWRIGARRGLRLRALDAGDLERALAAHRHARGAALLKQDGRGRISAGRVGARAVVIKAYRPGGPLRRLADAFRGSPARRAWRAGHGLAARGIGAATPLAFLERRRFGLPGDSLAVFEDLRPAPTADALPGDPERLGRALAALLIALHRAGVWHGDLKASHVFLPGAHGDGAGAARPRLIDLEGVRFRRRLSDRRRIQALAELNASLPDALPGAVRARAFARYARALPFAAGPQRARERIVARSLARAHRWSGCDVGRPG